MKMTKGSDNIFADLGFEPQEAESLNIRATLMLEIEAYIRREKITQREAARRMGVTQPRVSDLMRHRIELFSVDGLIEMLSAVGMKIDVKVRRARAA